MQETSIDLDSFLELTKEAMASKKKTDKPAVDPGQFKDTQRREQELWHVWNNNGRKPEHLKPLLESIKPMLKAEASRWRGVEIPTSTINAEIRKQAVTAFKTYDPSKAQLNTWLNGTLRKSGRFIKKYQNLGKIPEGQIARIRKFKQAKDTLFNTMGYEPDTRTIADHLGWPHKRVVQLHKELSREDKPVSGWMQDPAEVATPKTLEAIHLIQFDTRMSAEERNVYEYTFGLNGKPKLTPGEIAKRANLHASKVSRIRNKLKTYLQEAMEVV